MQLTRICKTMALVAVAAALVLAMSSTIALAQDNVYALSYFSNAHTTNAPIAALRLINDGAVSSSSPLGDLCAAIYVFTPDEQLAECCSCRVTPNGLLSLSVNTNLTSNTLTGRTPTRGVVKVLSSFPVAGVCDPTNAPLTRGIRGWLTHIQKNSAFYVTEEELTDSTLSASEYADLQEDCGVLIELGSGQGTCGCADSGQ